MCKSFPAGASSSEKESNAPDARKIPIETSSAIIVGAISITNKEETSLYPSPFLLIFSITFLSIVSCYFHYFNEYNSCHSRNHCRTDCWKYNRGWIHGTVLASIGNHVNWNKLQR